jgi:hypothetical protein
METGQRALARQLWSGEECKGLEEKHPDLAWLFEGKKKRGARRTDQRQEQSTAADMGGLDLEYEDEE